MKQPWRAFASGTTSAACRSLARSSRVRHTPTATSTCWWSSSRARCRVCWHWLAWNWSFSSYRAGDGLIYGRQKTFPAISATRWCIRQRCSMLAEDRVRLRHMIEAAESAVQFIAGRQCTDLDEDRMLLFALVHAIEILGEAASKISEETRAIRTCMPWRAISGMRNRLMHAYFEI